MKAVNFKMKALFGLAAIALFAAPVAQASLERFGYTPGAQLQVDTPSGGGEGSWDFGSMFDNINITKGEAAIAVVAAVALYAIYKKFFTKPELARLESQGQNLAQAPQPIVPPAPQPAIAPAASTRSTEDRMALLAAQHRMSTGATQNEAIATTVNQMEVAERLKRQQAKSQKK